MSQEANLGGRKSPQTIVAHDEHDERHHGAVTTPIYQNSLFSFKTVHDFEEASSDQMGRHVYTRGNNPTVLELEKKLAALEGAEAARCFASGMAAISAAILSTVQAGDHIVCIDQAYAPARRFIAEYLPKFQIEATFVDGTKLEELKAAIKPNTTLVYLESPSSMRFTLQDIKACAGLAHQAGALVLIDNTWATPLYQNPLALGADLVIHSLTKFIGGHSDALGGAVLGRRELLEKLFYNEFLLLGSIMSPHTASLILRGLRSLPLRMKHAEQSGLEIARFLERQEWVHSVSHPGLLSNPQHVLATQQMSGFSSVFCFETPAGKERMMQWADALRLFRIGVSWGGYESLVIVNGAGDHDERSHLRLYIGLEDPADLQADLVAASESIGLKCIR